MRRLVVVWKYFTEAFLFLRYVILEKIKYRSNLAEEGLFTLVTRLFSSWNNVIF